VSSKTSGGRQRIRAQKFFLTRRILCRSPGVLVVLPGWRRRPRAPLNKTSGPGRAWSPPQGSPCGRVGVGLGECQAAAVKTQGRAGGNQMTVPHPPIVSRHDWLRQRQALLGAEKALTREGDRVNQARRRLPMVKLAATSTTTFTSATMRRLPRSSTTTATKPRWPPGTVARPPAARRTVLASSSASRTTCFIVTRRTPAAPNRARMGTRSSILRPMGGKRTSRHLLQAGRSVRPTLRPSETTRPTRRQSVQRRLS